MIGLPGFFEAIELREQLILVLAMQTGDIEEGDDAYRDLADRLDSVSARRKSQLLYLRHVLAEQPATFERIRELAIELHATTVGVQMVGVRMLSRESSFAGHMRTWIRDNRLDE